MARSSTQDQVIVLMNDWEDFGTKANADAYDKNIRWLASHPWVEMVTPDQIASGKMTCVPPDGVGIFRRREPRHGLDLADRGAGFHRPRHGGELRQLVLRHRRWKRVSPPNSLTSGPVRRCRKRSASKRVRAPRALRRSAWAKVASMSSGDSLLKIARGVYHASFFETAFHNNTNNDLSKFSTGAYIYPDTSYMTLADFSSAATGADARGGDPGARQHVGHGGGGWSYSDGGGRRAG